jgi:hypothetical protein
MPGEVVKDHGAVPFLNACRRAGPERHTILTVDFFARNNNVIDSMQVL